MRSLVGSTKIIMLVELIILCQVVSCAESTQMDNRIVWNPNINDETYKNPIIFADYSDPDVIRVGEDFYMTTSSFNCVPG